MKKKFLAVILTMAMCASLLPAVALPSETANASTPGTAFDVVVPTFAAGWSVVAIKTDGSVWTEFEQLPGINNAVQVAVGAGDFGWESIYVLRSDNSLWYYYADTGVIRGGPEKVMDNVIHVAAKQGTLTVIDVNNDLWVKDPSIYPDSELRNVMSDVADATGGPFALKTDGSVWDVRNNTKIMDEVIKIDSLWSMLYAVKRDGSLWVWGDSWWNHGNAGTAVGQYYRFSTPYAFETNVKSISVGVSGLYVMKNNNTMLRWRSGNTGQQINVGSDVVHFSAATGEFGGNEYAVLIRSNGRVFDVLGLERMSGVKLPTSRPGGVIGTVTHAATPTITTQPSNTSVNQGGTATLRVVASVPRGTLSYQWYSSATNANTGGTPINGARSATYSPPTANSATMYYYCIVTNTDNNATGNRIASVTSRAAQVTVSSTRRTVDFYLKSTETNNVIGSGETVKLSINWSDDFFSGNATIANGDLAIASLVLSQAAYDQVEARDALVELGFSNIRLHYDLTQSLSENRVACSFANKKAIINGKETVIVAIVLRGTPPGTNIFNEQQWRANVFLPFEYAAEDVTLKLDSYMTEVREQHQDLSLSNFQDVKFLITGHSRGAAVATLLSAQLKNGLPQENVFTYCFATPNTHGSNNSFDYPNIINILNNDDGVTKDERKGWATPPLWSSFKGKLGVSVWFNPDNTPNFRNSFERLTGRRYDKSDHSHNLDTYLSWLLSARTLTPATSGRTRVITIRCPVDFEIYNSGGRLVGRVVDNEVDENFLAADVFIWIDGDEKYVTLSPNGEYTIKMTGSDDGIMNYSIDDADLDTWDTIGVKEFNSVALSDGKQMASHVGGGIGMQDVQLLVIENDEIIAKILEDGAEVPFTDGEAFAADIAALTWDIIKGENTAQNNVTADLMLPRLGAHGTAISWGSSDAAAISESGEVTRPDAGSSGKTVTLTATLALRGETDTVAFTLTVPAMPGGGGGSGGSGGIGGGSGTSAPQQATEADETEDGEDGNEPALAQSLPKEDVTAWFADEETAAAVAEAVEEFARKAEESTGAIITQVSGPIVVPVENPNTIARVTLPEGIDAGRITTMAVVTEGGDVIAVPTRVNADGTVLVIVSGETVLVPLNVIPSFADIGGLLQHVQDDIIRAGTLMLVEGRGNGIFDPAANITNQEAAAIYLRALGIPVEYADAMAVAAAEGLFAAGTQGSAEVNRMGTAMLIVNALESLGLGWEASPEETEQLISRFIDLGSLTDPQKTAMAVMIKLGIFQGHTDGRMGPRDVLQRYQMAILAVRVQDLIFSL